MHKKICRNTNERGNVVALTLLGLAVAILAGVTMLYVIGNTAPAPVVLQEKEVTNTIEPIINPRDGWISYDDEQYDFHIEIPQGWMVATGTLSFGDPVISVFPAQGTSTPSIYHPDDIATHVSIYPYGVSSTTSLRDVTKSSVVIVETPQAAAKDYLLESGKPWATKAIFEQYPETWRSDGFVFLRVLVEEDEVVYLRDGEQILESDFDSTKGDQMKRRGFIDVNVRSLEEEILRSFHFASKDESISKDGQKNYFIQFESALENTALSSPVLLHGSVLGERYPYAELSVLVESADGVTLAEVPVTLEGHSASTTTSFDVSVVFDAATATSGYIIFKHPQSDDKSMRVPVQFTYHH